MLKMTPYLPNKAVWGVCKWNREAIYKCGLEWTLQHRHTSSMTIHYERDSGHGGFQKKTVQWKYPSSWHLITDMRWVSCHEWQDNKVWRPRELKDDTCPLCLSLRTKWETTSDCSALNWRIFLIISPHIISKLKMYNLHVSRFHGRACGTGLH